jgi:intermembrane space import and assembly protein 40
MQDCFRKYPEIYGSELADDDEGEAAAPAQEGAEALQAKPAETQASAGETKPPASREGDAVAPKKSAITPTETRSDGVPVKAVDATEANKGNGQ